MQLWIDDDGSFLYAPIVGPGQLGHVRICPMDLSLMAKRPHKQMREKRFESSGNHETWICAPRFIPGSDTFIDQFLRKGSGGRLPTIDFSMKPPTQVPASKGVYEEL